MTSFHRWLGFALIVAFVAIALWGTALRLLRRDEAPTALWVVQNWTENLLVVQTVVGVVLLLLGRRVHAQELAWLHYFYGSLFPLIALVGGRISGLRRERYEYVGLVWGSFFALGLTLRALQMGCGAAPNDLARCFGIGA